LPFRQTLCAYSLALLELLLGQGDHDAVRKELRQLVSTVPPERKTPGIVSTEHAAKILARCAALAGKDEKLSAEKRLERQQLYGDEAVKLLEQAVSQGYKEAKVLQTAADFAALQPREDFQQLVRQLERKP